MDVWERIVEYLGAFREDAEEWCEDRYLIPRALLLLYLIYAGVRHLFDPLYRSWFAGITLIFHEMGHLLFAFFGRTLTLLGGSLMQLIVPLAAAIYLLVRQRDYFGLAVGTAWLSFSVWELATYVGDASREQLPLVGFGGRPEHDWSTLLTQWHLLNYDGIIAGGLRVGAFVMWLASAALGAWLCYRIWRSRAQSGGSAPLA